MDAANLAALQSAVDKLAERRVEPFVNLIADDAVWRGAERRWPWRRTTPV